MTTPHQPQPHTDGWQDIATAPSNTAVIATDGKNVGEACLIDYGDDVLCGWYWATDRDAMAHKPTLWQPLPKPPSTTQSKKIDGRQSDV